MTETKTRSPEYQLAQGVLGGLRRDLFHDAFAYRPLAPMRTEGPFTKRLSGRIGSYAGWTPHALVLGAAMITLLLTFTTGSSDNPVYALSGLVPAGAVALTLTRPVGAWWVSLAFCTPAALMGDSFEGWPWPPGMFFGYLAVLTVVAARTRPRIAAWMWAATALFAIFMDTLFGPHMYGNDTPEMLVLSAVALLITTTVHIRREAKQEVTAQRNVTAVERDKRTLLEERTNIARELHDVVAHHMSVVAIQAEAAPYRVTDPPPELTRSFEVIRENAVAALTELRRVLGVVRAEDYEAPDAPQPTLAELDALLANVRDAGLTVHKTVTGAVRELPQGVELSAYRIVQEALSNALRHAPGAEARVEVGYVLGGLGLRVVNGVPRGLVKPTPGAGHGLTGMRERVTMLNGELTAEPTAEGGFEVTAFLPVQRSAGEKSE